jgi:hypothetical protein
MLTTRPRRIVGHAVMALTVVVLLPVGSVGRQAHGAEPSDPETASSKPSPSDILTPEQWIRVDGAVDRGLAYLASQQQVDGSIAAPTTGQPGITALAVMAFLSRGHTPGEGLYGAQMLEAIDFVLSCQRSDGLLSVAEPEPVHVHEGASHTGNYNHAIAGADAHRNIRHAARTTAGTGCSDDSPCAAVLTASADEAATQHR